MTRAQDAARIRGRLRVGCGDPLMLGAGVAICETSSAARLGPTSRCAAVGDHSAVHGERD